MAELQKTNGSAGTDHEVRSRALHRWSWAMLALVWPLVWVGSLVTTADAGMSVPDWPNTYGYNLFLYPVSTWLTGPFDLLVEHGHRLLGAVVGVVAIITVVAAWLSDSRRWVQGLSVFGLLLVIGQGVLGGLRVTLSDRVLAMTHGCTAPIVFGVFTALMVVSSRWWMELPERPRGDQGPRRRLGRAVTLSCGTLVFLVWGQIVLGAQLRHVSMAASPTGFMHTTNAHLGLAFGVWALFAVIAWRLRGCGEIALSRPVVALLGLVGVQIALGLGTWVVNYGFPMFQDQAFVARHLVVAKSFWGAVVVCGHVATGSLILAAAVLLWVRTWRLRHVQAAEVAGG